MIIDVKAGLVTKLKFKEKIFHKVKIHASVRYRVTKNILKIKYGKPYGGIMMN